jgi:hypothetical protein
LLLETLIVYNYARGVWTDCREVKKKPALRQCGEHTGATAEKSHELHSHPLKPQ